MSNPESPYVGPRPFTKGDENIFYGRDAEAQALMSLIVSHSAVLLYSQSGAGKTSLLNAKVRGLLEARNVNVLGSSRVGGSLPPDVDPKEIENIFVYFALISLAGDEPTKELCRGNTTLLEYLESLPRRTLSDGGLVQRVIIFDQFEEIFTTSQQRWKDRDGFFEQVGLALEADPLLRVVFAMREEYLASLGVYVANLPERLRTRFHLERLRYEQALEAVTKPLKGTKRRFAPGVAEQLVRNLLRVPVRSESGFQEITGEFVEPVQLQVVCQNIWNSLGDDVNEIDAKFVESSGDVDVALTNYYEDCLRRLMEQHTIKEARLRRWFDNELITTDGLRGIVYQGETTTGTLPNKVVAMLEDLRLVRAEPRGGALWYELTHDRFIAPIRNSNRAWFSKQQGGLATALDTKVIEYRNDPRDENLIRGSELTNALEWLETAEAEDSEVSDSLRSYILDSKNASTKRRARSLRRQVAVLVLLFLGALFMAGWAYREKGRADRARYDERAGVALTMIELKKYYDALVWGLKSVEPSLSGDKPSPQGIDSLRNALKAVGGNLWSRTFPSRQKVDVSADGRFVLTFDDREFALWDGSNGRRVFLEEFSEEAKAPGTEKRAEDSPAKPPRISSAAFSTAGKFLILRRLLPVVNDSRQPQPGVRQYQLEVLDLQNNLRQIINERGPKNLKFVDNDSKLVISDNESFRILDLATNRTIFPMVKNTYRTFVSPTGDRIVQIIGGAVSFRNLNDETVKVDKQHVFRGDESISGTFSDDGKTVLIFEDNNSAQSRLTLWDAVLGRKIGEIPISSQGSLMWFRVFSANRAVLIVNQFDEIAEIWDVNNNTVRKINDSEAPLTYDLRSGHLLLQNPGSIKILIDPRDQTNVVEFNNLPERISIFVPSEQLTSAITLSEDNVLQYWKPGSFSAEVDNLPERELYRAACNKLRYQEKEFKQVATLCEPLLK